MAPRSDDRCARGAPGGGGGGAAALSFFQSGSLWRDSRGFEVPHDGGPSAHLMQELRYDGLGIAAALLWLTEEELSAPPTALDSTRKPEVEEAWPNGWRYEYRLHVIRHPHHSVRVITLQIRIDEARRNQFRVTSRAAARSSN